MIFNINIWLIKVGPWFMWWGFFNYTKGWWVKKGYWGNMKWES